MDTLIIIATKIFFIGIVGLFSIRLLGKHTLSEITPFDVLYMLVLGDIMVDSLYDGQTSVWNNIAGILLWTLFYYILQKILQKTDSISQTIEGEPELLIDQGKLNYRTMKKNNLKIEQVRKLLRKSGISTLAEAYYAVFEVDGSITAITEEDKNHLSFGVINNGELIKDVIEKTLNIDEQWIHKELENQDIPLRDIVYGEYRLDGKLFVYTDDDFITDEDAGVDE